MPAKQKKPGTKRRTKSRRGTSPAASTEQVSRRQSKRTLVVLAVVAVCFIVGVVVNNTTGFWYERQSFPGAQDSTVASGRTALEARVANTFLNKLQTLPAGGTITPVLQKRTDMCIKGQHDSGPGGHVDPWAYNCQLFYEGSFSYTASPCDVVHKLLAANISVSYREATTGQDCTAGAPQMRTTGGRTWYESSDSQMAGWDAAVDTPSDFLSSLARSNPSSSSTCDGGSSTVVYCQVKNTSKPAAAAANYGIPADAQAIVSYYIYDTYYQR